jgi:hypothetical protein
VRIAPAQYLKRKGFFWRSGEKSSGKITATNNGRRVSIPDRVCPDKQESEVYGFF